MRAVWTEADVCGKRCDHGSECLLLRGHMGGHDTQHGCTFYDAEQPPLRTRAALTEQERDCAAGRVFALESQLETERTAHAQTRAEGERRLVGVRLGPSGSS